MIPLDFTHDPNARSWVESANDPGADFPIQNLPFAVFRPQGADAAFRCGVAIGDQIIDLPRLAEIEGLSASLHTLAKLAAKDSLAPIMRLGADGWRTLRHDLFRLLTVDSLFKEPLQGCVIDQASVEYALPCTVGDFTDFYTSVHHARKTAQALKPGSEPPANFFSMPMAYHGRSSTVQPGGGEVSRPQGQRWDKTEDRAIYGPSTRLDYEVELGVLLGVGHKGATALTVDEAEEHIFGVCLLNDWSARDFQAWEGRPLGPFLAKNFATTLSPWIVTLDALRPYRCAMLREPAPHPVPEYLDSDLNSQHGAYPIQITLALESTNMRRQGIAPQTLANVNFSEGQWTLAQMVTHHTANGCSLRAGDLLGTGTISGAGQHESGCLLELTKNGKAPVALNSGEERAYLEDGDRVIMQAQCTAPSRRRIGFGILSDTVAAPIPLRPLGK
ncbi:MAG: fumarylacetoacetase [Pseudomonadota bacterium]